jgi:hypothetical protein
MPANYVLLERVELNTTTTNVTFSNIPQSGYTDLKIVISARDSATSTNFIELGVNGSTANFTSRRIQGTGSAASSSSFTNSYAVVETNNQTASTFGSIEIYCPNYTSSNFKSFSVDTVTENNATAATMEMWAWLWSQTAAINSLTINGNFLQYSTFSLYGLAAVGTTPVIAPKASGGNRIDYDGTYYYHVFNTTGAFVPQTGLSCDYIVVAGGGGGGPQVGGGGGAGGLRLTTSQILTPTSYTVTVGGGGAGAGTYGITGFSGTTTSFNSYAVSGGGGGGFHAATASNGVAGGSGGGGGGGNSGLPTGGAGNTGSYSPVEGYAGGNGTGTGTYGAGGGGGASAVGNAGSGGTGGAGGAGANSYNGTTFTSWLSATSTGVSGYLAGGGGGCSNSGGSGGAGGIGGGGTGSGPSSAGGTSGTTNTGGGGGGYRDGTGGNGGSGIVIIRYLAA